MADTNNQNSWSNIANTFANIGADLSANDAIGAGVVVGGINPTFSQTDEKETGESETQTEPKEFSTDEDIYVLNKGDWQYPEVYSESQIDAMRNIVAKFDARESSNSQTVDTSKSNTYKNALDQGSYASIIAENKKEMTDEATDNNDTGLGEHFDSVQDINVLTVDSETQRDVNTFNSDTSLYLHAGAANGETGEFSFGIHKIETEDGNTVTAVNRLNIRSNWDTKDDYTMYSNEAQVDHMREIIAEADAIDGKGTYEDNLEALKDKSYQNYAYSDSDDDSLYADAESDDDYNEATEYSESAGSETKATDKGEKAKEVLGDITEKALDIEEDMELN